ncbi:TIR domain-containing adapter molecule 1 isoform 1-T2 [Polymixia lowei]
MEGQGTDQQGTGLTDVFKILVEVSQERLLSLTLHLGASPEEELLHALCLIFLQRGAEGLSRLQTLQDNHLANHLAEEWRGSRGELEDFRAKCGHFQDVTAAALAVLARIFKVLCVQRLCDPPLRDLAYKKAILAYSQTKVDSDCLKYTDIDHLREEAKVVCGPQFAEWMCSGSYCGPGDELESTALKHSLSRGTSESSYSPPSSLHTNSTASYPTHLEISLPPTDTFHGDRVSQIKPAQEKSYATQPRSFATLGGEYSEVDCYSQNPDEKQTAVPTDEPKPAPIADERPPPKIHVPHDAHEDTSLEEEEEALFYSFVILHAPEDIDMAERMRDKMESLTVGVGATFTEDFALPGKSTLMCIDDAINNSAFTVLLLTSNFNTRLLEVETESALINSINKKHKYNTVIPLLPRENCLPRNNMPLVLQTVVPLEENRSFERKIKKALTPAKIKSLRRMWSEEQRVKKQVRRQERLKHANEHQKKLNQEQRKADLLEREKLRLLMEQRMRMSLPDSHSIPASNVSQVGGDGVRWSNIHIENAQYIMIGNDSQMTVDLGGVLDNDGVVDSQDK